MHAYNCPCAACEISRIDDDFGAASRRTAAPAPAVQRASAPAATVARPSSGRSVYEEAVARQQAAASASSGRSVYEEAVARHGGSTARTATVSRAPSQGFRPSSLTQGPVIAARPATATRATVSAPSASSGAASAAVRQSASRVSAASVAASTSKLAEVAAAGEGQKKNWLTQSLRVNRDKIKPALSVKQVGFGASAYFRPEVPKEVQEAIPNYYAQTRKDRNLPEVPGEASGSDHEIAKYIVQNLAEDPDRRNTVEETIYVVLILASQQALQAGDFASAKVLTDTAQKWADTLSKAAQAQQGSGLSGFMGDLGIAASEMMEEKGTGLLIGVGLIAGLVLLASRSGK